MKKLFMTLTMVAFLASCGKSNSVSGGGAYSEAITIDNPIAQQIGHLINNNQFGTGVTSAGYTWGQLAMYYPGSSYKHGLPIGGTSTNNGCELKEGWFKIKYYVCKNSGSNAITNYNIVKSTPVNTDLEAKKGELRSILNSAVANGIQYSQAYDGYIVYVKTTSGDVFVIDTRIPVQANPAGHMNSAGATTYYFLGMQ